MPEADCKHPLSRGAMGCRCVYGETLGVTGPEQLAFSGQEAGFSKHAAQNAAHLPQNRAPNTPDPDTLAAMLRQVAPEARADFLRALADTLDRRRE